MPYPINERSATCCDLQLAIDAILVGVDTP
jgi:hypothetical protein